MTESFEHGSNGDVNQTYPTIGSDVAAETEPCYQN